MTTPLLRTIDLNLLVVLDALLSEKHVTRTGERLHLSQPAISHSLSKLRTLLDDPLLIRNGNEVVLSVLAENLRAPLKEILRQVEGVFGKSLDFDPASSERTFELAMSDYGAAIVLPGLLVRLRREAPNISLNVTQGSRHDMFELVSRGKIDLALGVFPSLAPEIAMQVLFEETFCCLLDRQTLPASGVLDLPEYLARPHLQVSVDASLNGEVDSQLRARGLQRRVAVSVPHWRIAPQMVHGTDLILTVATRTLDEAMADPRLLCVPPPLAIAPFPFVHIWHQRFSDDPAHAWLRRQISEVAAGPEV